MQSFNSLSNGHFYELLWMQMSNKFAEIYAVKLQDFHSFEPLQSLFSQLELQSLV